MVKLNWGDIMHVTQNVAEEMAERLKNCLARIQKYNLDYDEIGIFGSYARGEYKSTSDIDICIIIKNRPSHRISGNLRDDLEELRADLVWVTPESFKNSDTVFMSNLRRDYRRIL